ncbi:hypothetical protein [Streptomyces sp. NPDC051219]|uniref:hypothetical protein n=1 Tax=Streptomyces sp. NPDC051219 TaxID=3155283 RepID=UPI0034377F25
MFKSGVGFLALFGLGWWLLGTSAFNGPARLVPVVAGCVVAVALMLAARHFLSQAAGLRFSAHQRLRFNQINGAQWLLIVVVAVVCGLAGVPVLVPPLVALVVGLHFLPLARVFEQPRLLVPSVLLVAAGAAGMVVWVADGPAESVRLVVGLTAALSLWGTAIWTVAEGAISSRRSAGQ